MRFVGQRLNMQFGLIVTVLTGRGPRSPGSIEFLFLIWTGYFNLGSSWLSKDREGGKEEKPKYMRIIPKQVKKKKKKKLVKTTIYCCSGLRIKSSSLIPQSSLSLKS